MKYIFTLSLSLLYISIFSQDIGKQYGNLYNDEAFSIVPDNNGNFFIVGSVRTFEKDYEKVRLLKINNDGEKLFDKYFGSGYRNRGLDIILLKDNNLLICGETWGGFGSQWGRRNVFLLKVDRNGNEIWSNYFYYTARDQSFSVKELKSKDIIVIGYSKSFNGSGTIGDVYFLKTNSAGEKLWDKSYNDKGNDYGFDVIEKENGNYIILSVSGGYYNSNQFDYRYSHDAEIMLIETNNNGNELSRKYWGTNKHDFGREIIKDAANNGYYIIGSTQSFGNGSFDILLLKTDNDGNEKWIKTYEGVDFDYGISIEMAKNKESLYLLGTTYDNSSEKTKIFILKTDLEGNELWSHEIGNDFNYSGKSVKSLNEGGCVIVGAIRSNDNKTNNIYVQIFDKNGNIKFNLNDLDNINTFPNPVLRGNQITFELTHKYKSEYNTIEIFDVNSKLIQRTNFTDNSWSFFTSKLNAGIYFYNICAKGKNISGKFIVY